jgi:hypothetical protein
MKPGGRAGSRRRGRSQNGETGAMTRGKGEGERTPLDGRTRRTREGRPDESLLTTHESRVEAPLSFSLSWYGGGRRWPGGGGLARVSWLIAVFFKLVLS